MRLLLLSLALHALLSGRGFLPAVFLDEHCALRPLVCFRLSCDSFIVTYSDRGSLDDRIIGSDRSFRVTFIGLERAGIGLEWRTLLKLGEGRWKIGSSVPATTGDVRAWVRSNAWVKDKGCPMPDLPNAPPKADTEATVSGVVSVPAVEPTTCPKLLRFLPATAGVSNFRGLVNDCSVRTYGPRSSSNAVGLVITASGWAWLDSTTSTPSVRGSASSSSSCSVKSDFGPDLGLGMRVVVSAVPKMPLVHSLCIWLSGCVSPGASMPPKL